MDPNLLASFVPSRWSCIGIELRPFSLGHRILLHSLASPFVADAAPVTPANLMVAVQVCARTWEDGLILCRDTHESDRAVGAMLRKQARDLEWQKHADHFAQYLGEGSRVPNFTMPGPSGGTRWTPWEQSMRICLMRELGLSESDVMNRPLVLSWWDYLTVKEEEGTLTISTQDEQEFANRMFARADELCREQQN